MRLLELYTSVQGEGPNVGKPTTFVRFAGCNMRCPGWPCDTPYAIYPDQWRKEAENVDPKELFLRINERTPKHVCITGGEPLIQPKEEMKELLWFLFDNLYSVDIFTNGSRPIYDPEQKVNLLMNHVTFIMDWKLPGSGEGDTFPTQRKSNLERLRPRDAVKLVIKDKKDMLVAEELINEWRLHRSDFQVYVGTAWDKMREADLVRWMEEMGFHWVKLNVQVHKFIWDPQARKI